MVVLASWAVGLVLGGDLAGRRRAARPRRSFLVAGAILGSGLGGVQVADRVLMVRLSPPERLGEFFGLYGLVGKGSQVIGQLLYGLIIFLFLDTLRRRRLPARGPEPARARCSSGCGCSGRSATMGRLGRGARWTEAPPRAARPDVGAARAALRLAARPGSRRGCAAATPRPSRSSPRGSAVPAPSPGPRARGRASDEHRRVAGPTRTDRRTGSAGRRPPRPPSSDLADAEPAAVAEVEDERLGRPRIVGRGRLEGEQVRVGEVGDVDVVADARSVGRRVVVAEERQRLGPSRPAREDVRDEVGLGVVDLAVPARSRRRH